MSACLFETIRLGDHVSRQAAKDAQEAAKKPTGQLVFFAASCASFAALREMFSREAPYGLSR
jgi:hypothetical protein